MAERVVTHDGDAHMDDLLSVCLVLAHDGEVTSVERRPPTEAELAHPGVWVLDVGFRHEPARLDFDHHQFPAGTRQCCFSLLAQHLEVVDDFEAMSWYRALVAMDALGPAVAARELGCTTAALGALHGPVQRWLLQEFSRQSALDRDGDMFAMLRRIGTYLASLVSLRRERLVLLAQKAEWVEVAGHTALLFLEDLPDPGSFMDDYQTSCGRRADAVVTRNNRNQGWALRRVDDDGPVDFRRVAGDPALCFVHASGFMAATDGYLPRGEILRLLAGALGA